MFSINGFVHMIVRSGYDLDKRIDIARKWAGIGARA